MSHRTPPKGGARRPSIISVAVLLLMVISGCGEDQPSISTVEGDAVTIAATAEGGFLWASLEGEVRDESGSAIGSVEVSTDGQRGLLGLAIDDQERVFVSYTDPTFALVVSELTETGEREIWRGPTTVQGGSGGRMIAHDGELILGIGLLNDREGQADPESIVGKMIAIDPDLAPTAQRPRILSGPWNNPFAFDVTDGGELWVADNHPRDGDERLARGDLGFDPDVPLVLPADSAPSGLAAGDDVLFVCSYNDLTLTRYDIVDGAPQPSDTVATDCVLDVTLLSNGDLAYSTGTSIVRISP